MDTPGPTHETAACATLICDDVLDLSGVDLFQTRLLAALASGKDVEIRADRVERIDTASLQLICATARDLQVLGRSLLVTSPSVAFTSVARRLGLAGLLGVTSSVAEGGAQGAAATMPPLTQDRGTS